MIGGNCAARMRSGSNPPGRTQYVSTDANEGVVLRLAGFLFATTPQRVIPEPVPRLSVQSGRSVGESGLATFSLGGCLQG